MDGKMMLFQDVLGLFEKRANGINFLRRGITRILPGYEVFDGDTKGRGDPDGFRGLGEDFTGAPVTKGLIFYIGGFSKGLLRHFSFFNQRIHSIPESWCHMTIIYVFLLKINIILLDNCSYITILDYRNAVE